MKYTDEHLSAFLDGELPEAKMQAIEMALETDMDLVARLEALAIVDTKLQDIFNPVIYEPVPDRIMSLLEHKDTKTQSNVIHLSEHRDRRAIWQLPAAVAASLLAGFFAAQSFNSVSQNSGQIATGPVNSSSALYAVLSDIPSGESRKGIEPLLSFETTDGNICREFTAQSSRALACRNTEGWTVISQTYTPGIVPQGGYATASSESGEAFDSLVDSLMFGEVLTSDREKALIAKKWQE